MNDSKKIADLEQKIEDQQREIEMLKNVLKELGVNLEGVHKASEK